MCGCVDGDLQCTRDERCAGEDEEEDDDEMMCRMCASMPKRVVCGPNAVTYPNRCSAMRCGGFTADEISDGPCSNVVSCNYSIQNQNSKLIIRHMTFSEHCIGMSEP